MKTASSFQMPSILLLLLLTIFCAQSATAQYKKSRLSYHLPASTQTKTEQAAPQAQPTPESSPTPASVTPSNNMQPVKESEPLPFKLDEKSDASAEAPSAAGLLLRTLGALLLIVGLIVAA